MVGSVPSVACSHPLTHLQQTESVASPLAVTASFTAIPGKERRNCFIPQHSPSANLALKLQYGARFSLYHLAPQTAVSLLQTAWLSCLGIWSLINSRFPHQKRNLVPSHSCPSFNPLQALVIHKQIQKGNLLYPFALD